LKRIANFQKSLINNQKSLIQFVEDKSVVHSAAECKSEEHENYKVEEEKWIKTESIVNEEIDNLGEDNFVEYLDSEIEEQNEKKEEETTIVEYDQIYVENKSEAMKPRKVYKRACCNICGKSYYADQLRRHIDKVNNSLIIRIR
jgi:hypothetical protein